MSQPVQIAYKGEPTGITRSTIDDANDLASVYALPTKTMQGKSATFKSALEAQGKSPTAFQILMVHGVERVVLGTDPKTGFDTMTITMNSHADWAKNRNLAEIKIVAFTQFAKNTPKAALANLAALEPEMDLNGLIDSFNAAGNPEGVSRLKAVIAITNKGIAHHGGEIQYVGYNQETSTLAIGLDGNCSGCAASQFTVQNTLLGHYKRLENVLRVPVKEIKVVRGGPATPKAS